MRGLIFIFKRICLLESLEEYLKQKKSLTRNLSLCKLTCWRTRRTPHSTSKFYKNIIKNYKDKNLPNDANNLFGWMKCFHG